MYPSCTLTCLISQVQGHLTTGKQKKVQVETGSGLNQLAIKCPVFAYFTNSECMNVVLGPSQTLEEACLVKGEVWVQLKLIYL